MFSFWRWLSFNAAALQALSSAASILFSVATLIFLIRYANDTRLQRQLAEQQFKELVADNKRRRLAEHKRLLREDSAATPELRIQLIRRTMGYSALGQDSRQMVDVYLHNDGSGGARDVVFRNSPAGAILFRIAALDKGEDSSGKEFEAAVFRNGQSFLLTYSSILGTRVTETYDVLDCVATRVSREFEHEYDYLLDT